MLQPFALLSRQQLYLCGPRGSARRTSIVAGFRLFRVSKGRIAPIVQDTTRSRSLQIIHSTDSWRKPILSGSQRNWNLSRSPGLYRGGLLLFDNHQLVALLGDIGHDLSPLRLVRRSKTARGR